MTSVNASQRAQVATKIQHEMQMLNKCKHVRHNKVHKVCLTEDLSNTGHSKCWPKTGTYVQPSCLHSNGSTQLRCTQTTNPQNNVQPCTGDRVVGQTKVL